MSEDTKNEVQAFGYRLPRFSADFRLVLQVPGPPPRLLDARCCDISEDGLKARVQECLPIGSRVTLLLTLPNKSASLAIAATVNHEDNGDHGFAFQFPSVEERERVRQYVQSLHKASLGRAASK